MTNFENIVRPFQIQPLTPFGTRLRPPVDPVVVECALGGMGGRTVTFSFTGNGFKTLSLGDQKFKEVDRSSTKVKVENADDTDNFVEFCRPDRVDFASQKPSPLKATSFSDPANAKKSSSEYTYQHPSDKACQAQPSQPKKGC